MPIRENRKELKTILENISDGILFIDNLGTIKFYNRTLSAILAINGNLLGMRIFSLPADNPLRQGVFRADAGFHGPYCWERNNCREDTACPGRNSQCCRCWVFSECGSGVKNISCIECAQYQSVKRFLEKPREFEIDEKTISVISTFIEYGKKNEIWEVIVFRDVTYEKLDAVVKLAGAAAHELRQPLQIITSCISLLSGRLPEGPGAKEDFDTIKESCYRMNDIIEKISHITRYKTKNYIHDEKILDIEESSNNGKSAISRIES